MFCRENVTFAQLRISMGPLFFVYRGVNIRYNGTSREKQEVTIAGVLSPYSTMLVRHQKQTGQTATQSFKIQKSKPIIDKIDRVLAQHYGFTDEGLDFIINYDIKYRMGLGNE